MFTISVLLPNHITIARKIEIFSFKLTMILISVGSSAYLTKRSWHWTSSTKISKVSSYPHRCHRDVGCLPSPPIRTANTFFRPQALLVLRLPSLCQRLGHSSLLIAPWVLLTQLNSKIWILFCAQSTTRSQITNSSTQSSKMCRNLSMSRVYLRLQWMIP